MSRTSELKFQQSSGIARLGEFLLDRFDEWAVNRLVQGVPSLSPCDSRDRLQPPLQTRITADRKWINALISFSWHYNSSVFPAGGGTVLLFLHTYSECCVEKMSNSVPRYWKKKILNLLYKLSQDSEWLGQRWWGVSSAPTSFGEFKLHKRFHKLFGQGCWVLTGAGTQHVCQSDKPPGSGHRCIKYVTFCCCYRRCYWLLWFHFFTFDSHTYTVLSDHFCIYEQNYLLLSHTVEREVQKSLYLPGIWKCKRYSSCWIVVF